MSQDVKLHIFRQIHTPSGNRLTGSYFCSVTDYDKQTSFTALVHTKFVYSRVVCLIRKYCFVHVHVGDVVLFIVHM